MPPASRWACSQNTTRKTAATTGSSGTGRSGVSWLPFWVPFQHIKGGIPIENQLSIQYFVGHEREGTYLTIPFNMPPDTESFSLAYRYERHHESGAGKDGFSSREEINIIDLGLIAPDGTQVGASGSDKTKIEVSETYATPGYRSCRLIPGEWQILLGAYKVAPDGVTVFYDLAFTPKRLRLFKGDLHLHTLASDGVLSVEELAQHALRHGLDFLAITDHNQMVSAESLPKLPGLTLIPGIEWTHFKGHANFLGVDKPYDEPFFANSLEEMQARFNSARERGALITINHPFDEICPFTFDMDSLPYDCLEIWNGPMRDVQPAGAWVMALPARSRQKESPSAAGAIITATTSSSSPADRQPASTPCRPARRISLTG